MFTESTELRVVNADGTGDSAVKGVKGVAQHDWTAGGTRLAHTDNTLPGIKVVDIRTRAVTTIVPQFHGSAILRPRWSPDGGRLVFEARDSIYVVNADGSSLRKIVDDVDHSASPVWSPDGTQLAFVRRSHVPGAAFRVWVVNDDGYGPRELPTEGPSQNPQWSPDGASIAYDDGMSIWIAPAAGGAPRRILSPPCAPQCGSADEYEFPQWSPDGTRLTGMQGPNVWIVNADGSGLMKINAGGWLPPRPQWSPSGKYIVFVNTAGDVNDLYVMTSDGTSKRAVAATRWATEEIHRWIP
jgi:Tol biopolymer transport system component